MNDMKVLPQMFRSTPTGRLLTDQQVPLKWCQCGCGEAISTLADRAGLLHPGLPACRGRNVPSSGLGHGGDIMSGPVQVQVRKPKPKPGRGGDPRCERCDRLMMASTSFPQGTGHKPDPITYWQCFGCWTTLPREVCSQCARTMPCPEHGLELT